MAVDILMKRKIIVLGERSVGKTSLVTKFVDNQFQDSYFPTIENTSNKSVTYDGVEYDCDIIDTAGQDETAIFPPKHAAAIHGFILVYSIASVKSFEAVKVIYDKIKDFRPEQNIPCVIVGSKVDLPDRKVPSHEGAAFAEQIHASFVETSAKMDKNVAEVFKLALVEVEKCSPNKKDGAQQKGGCIIM
ncbi:hypothetical protein SCHPADRAFT_964507 [Schizopora paradoxa]|uniref:Uncharacterized protein n=1 Tax=Schizopora paradoxa TaxID=27342 RepID=A0A0H2SDE2_9AGAM|nr:hypothetical protein SCHPADRAFT_964507 [Schizopora paradoxa]